MRLERTRLEGGRAVGTGEFFEVPCGMVLPAIGYMSKPIEGAPFDARQGIVPNDDGRVEPGLYAVGWIKRGPTGVIASNRPDGVAVAGHIVKDFPQPGGRPGRAGLLDCLAKQGLRAVDFAEWEQIDAAGATAQIHHHRRHAGIARNGALARGRLSGDLGPSHPVVTQFEFGPVYPHCGRYRHRRKLDSPPGFRFTLLTLTGHFGIPALRENGGAKLSTVCFWPVCVRNVVLDGSDVCPTLRTDGHLWNVGYGKKIQNEC